MNHFKITFPRLLILILLLNVITQSLHEGGHWLVYQLSGRGPTWGWTALVQWWDTPPLHPENWVTTTAPDGAPGWLRLTSPAPTAAWEKGLAAAAGPLASLCTVLAGLWLARRGTPATRQVGLGLALVTALVMGLYYLRNPLRVGGDEFTVAVSLGLPVVVLNVGLGLAFLTGLALALRALGAWRVRLKWLGAFVLAGIPTGLGLNGLDGIVRAQVSQENPWFQPVLGFSFPVLAVNALAWVGLWLWWRAAKRAEASAA